MQNKANPLNQFLRTFYTYKFFTDFAFIYAVYVVLFKVRGLSIFQISLLLALWCGFVILLEVPTGALSDRWNRKWMLFLGMLAKVMAFTIWFFSHKFLFYALGFLLWGIQEAFASGTEEALLYDTLNKYGKTEDYEKIAGKSQFYSKIAVGTSVLLGGIIASYSLDLNIILSIISMLIAMITTLFFHEIEDAKLHVKRTTYKEMIKNSFKKIYHNKGIFKLIIYSFIVLSVSGTIEEYQQLYFNWLKISFSFYGVIIVIYMFFQALGNRLAYKFKSYFKNKHFIHILAILSGVSLFLSITYKSVLMLLFLGSTFFFSSISEILIQSSLQSLIKKSERATILSINSLMLNVSAIFLSIGFGLLAKWKDLRWGFGTFGVLMVGYALIAMIKGIKIRDEA